MKEIIKKTIRIALSPFVLFDYLKFKSKDRGGRFSKKISNFYPQIKKIKGN
jgi:hypothetical protein